MVKVLMMQSICQHGANLETPKMQNFARPFTLQRIASQPLLTLPPVAGFATRRQVGARPLACGSCWVRDMMALHA